LDGLVWCVRVCVLCARVCVNVYSFDVDDGLNVPLLTRLHFPCYWQVEPPSVLMTDSPNDLTVIKKGSDRASGGGSRVMMRVGVRVSGLTSNV
jgi:hypothetical protein